MWEEFKWCFMFCFSIGVISFVIGQLLPRDWLTRGDELWFSPFKREKNGKIYEKIKVRAWKNKVPDMSKYFHRMISKTLPTKPTAKDTSRLIRETCIAELTHEILMVTGVVCYIRFRSKWSFFLTFLWGLGNLPYVIIQRYNRPRLVRLRERQLLSEQNANSNASPLSP